MAQDQSGEIVPDVTLSEVLSAAKAKYAPAPSFMARCPATGSRKQWLRSMNRDEAGAISQNFYLRKGPDTPQSFSECVEQADFFAFNLWMDSQTDVEEMAFKLIRRLNNRKKNEKIARVEQGRELRSYEHDQTIEELREKDRVRQARHYAKTKALPKTDKEIEAIRQYEREKKAAYRARKKAGVIQAELRIPEEAALLFV